jgi:PIN domain nuclease of toxin-antitoxin system
VVHPVAWWQRHVTRASVEVLPVRVAHVDRLDELAEWHRDPFDRMLVAQALVENLTLASKDTLLAHMECRWCGNDAGYAGSDERFNTIF